MTTTTTNVPTSEVRRVYELLEKVQDLFHQPLNYEDSDRVRLFAEQNYEEIRDLYYRVVWNWLPEEVRKGVSEDQ